MKLNFKKGIFLGCTLIFVAIIIGILAYKNLIPENDLGFLFAGLGIVVTGFAILIHINSKKDDNK